MTSVERNGSFESAGLKRTRLKNVKDDNLDGFDDATKSVKNWIEDCTGYHRNDLSFINFIEDGVVLCELIQTIRPGLIKKISRVKSRFAYWENFKFFLEACKNLGLQDWQLFDPEELLGQRKLSGITISPSYRVREKKTRNIIATLYWLSRTLEQSSNYCGPQLDLTYFSNSCFTKFRSSDNSFTDYSSVSSTPTSTPSHTPEHKLISVCSPAIEQRTSPSSSPVNNGSDSSLVWVEKVQPSLENQVSRERYCFTQPEHISGHNRTSSQHSVTLTNSGDCDSVNNSQEIPKRRRERLSVVRVEAHNPPPAYSADLVFVQGSTSSSVLSPAVDNQFSSPSGTRFSLNQLSNTFGGTDPIDSTGLIIDPLEFHSEVFTQGTDSQDSGPHFSPRPESTFHVNLTQTSQPDLSISTTQLDEDFTEFSSQQELPVISEIVPNSNPIDTFDLHRTRQITCSNQTLTNIHNIEYSHSQDYNESHIQNPNLHLETRHLENSTEAPTSTTNKLHDTSSSSLQSEGSPNISSTSSTASSVIIVSYSPRTCTRTTPHSTNSLNKRDYQHNSETVYERRPPYRRYSSPQQRPAYKISRVSVTPPDSVPFCSESGSESDSEMSLQKSHRSSKKLMRVVPSNISTEPPKKENGLESHHTSDIIDIHITLLPGEKQLGFIIGDSVANGYPRVGSISGDTPAARSGIKSGDDLISVNNIPLQNMDHNDVTALIQKAIVQKKLLLSIRRDSSQTSFSKPILPLYQNGMDERQKMPIKIQPILSHIRVPGLDLQRVHSDALPKHQVASKVFAEQNVNNAGMYKQNSQELDLENSEILSDINSTAVEIGSLDTDSHHTVSSVGGNDIGSRSELNRSPSLPSVDEVLEPQDIRTEEQSEEPLDSIDFRTSSPQEFSPGISPTSPIEISTSDLIQSNGKSRSVTELSTISPVYTRHRAGTDIPHYATYTELHLRANKSESLPAKFWMSPEPEGESRTNSSTPSFGLNLQNMSIEDVHSASKLQIDQIWREVETSSNLVSPTDEEESRRHHMDTIFSQTPDESVDGDDKIDRLRSVKSEPVVIKKTDLPVDRSMKENEDREEDKVTEERSSNAPIRRSSSKANDKKGIESLLTTLRSLNEKVGTHDEEEEFKLLEKILQSSKFKKAKQLHDNMRDLAAGSTDTVVPESRRILPATKYIRHFLREELTQRTRETEELRRLLRKPDIQATLFCHDKIATHDLYVPSTYFPRSAHDQEDIILSHSAIDLQHAGLFASREAPLSRDVPSSRKENATIVYLQRSNRPLGCAIYKQGDSVFVSKILDGCDAEQSGAIKEGDELLEVNGIALIGKSNDEIIRLMSGEAGKAVAFTLIPVHDDTAELDYEEKYVQAHFGYNGTLDEEVPCNDLALSFTKGDILEISNQDDPDWWQARKVFEDGGESLPGLIPARHLQQKREVMRESYAVSVALEEKNKKKGILSKLSRKKKKKIYYNQGPLSGVFQSVGHEVATYEDVVKLSPDVNRRRPIVLIGAPNVGRRTLTRKLIESNSRHYSSCISHTTRPPRSGEVNHRDYHFVTREEMERGIQSGRFLEYGETKGHLYGMSVSSVRSVIDNGRVPVLDLHPQALKVIGSSGLLPYIIFIAAPRFDRLQMTRRVASEKRKKKMHTSISADALDRNVKLFTESELLQLSHASQEIQAEYSHYFDWIVVNDDFQVASDMLLEVARRIEEEPRWIPATWVEEV